MKYETRRIAYALFFPALLVLILWITMGFTWAFELEWYYSGIFPRTLNGLRGILVAPFIHSDVKHLFSNSIPLLTLGWCLFYFYKDLGYVVFPSIWLLSGALTWTIGRESWHIGASGLVYGMVFFLFLSGILRKHIPLLAVSMLVVFLYGGIVWNMFPISELIDPDTSWESHLSGALSGFLTSFLFRNKGPQKPEPPPEEQDLEEEVGKDETSSIE